MTHKTQVGIIGSGPAGLLLSQILHVNGIESIILEKYSRAHVEGRIRAGILEQGTVNMLEAAKVAKRLHKEALIHTGIGLLFNDTLHRIDFNAQSTGKSVTVYGQTEITKDLMDAHAERGQEPVYRAKDVQIEGIESGAPSLSYTHDEKSYKIDCDFVVGCDGYHGVSRKHFPESFLEIYERAYPFGWLGVLADVKPVSDELIYNNHPDGFALASQRSKTRSRYYIQCDLNEKLDAWSDDRFWATLIHRFGNRVGKHIDTGPSIEKSIAPLRSFVAEPMRYKSLFIAGDAAHIVPPTGAKGLNLAASDVHYLSDGLIEYYKTGQTTGLDCYSDKALDRVWKAIRFSWWFTHLTHRFPDHETGGFSQKLQLAELGYLVNSQAAMASLTENYVGLPF
ncbi:MAG: 4-hydroxybenzoate 3-monooxygenase [Verrucomicrobia bacterium]|nr:4-hydroxybenzoate 3-monooxygenase [Verrucomicrobiota bacterium]MDA1066676.1 4-hydroxybenzoate 3-monooxygenase [Verrucomicrobiota bacterium]